MSTPSEQPVLAREAAFLDGLVELMGYLDLGAAMQKVADLGHLVIGARTCHVRLLDEQGANLDLFGARGATAEEHVRKWRSLERSCSVVGEVLRTGTAYESHDIQNDEYYEMKEFAAKNKLVALRTVPIELRGRVVGAITLYFPRPEDITPERRMLAAMLARFAARVVEMGRGLMRTASGAEELVLPPGISSLQSADEAARAIAARALKLSRWQAAGVALPRGELGGVDFAGEAGDGQLLRHPQVMALSESAYEMGGIQDALIEPGKALLLSERRAAAFPCVAGEEQIGVITVVSMGTHPLDQAASRLLTLLATRSGDVLLRLMQRERLDVWEDLVSTLGVSSEDRVDPEKLQAELLDIARRQLGAEGAVLYLWDERVEKYTPRAAKGFKNVRRPLEYARDGYALGDAFVGQVAVQRRMVLLNQPDRRAIEADRCLALLRRQTHTQAMTLCLGIPIESQLRREDAPPIGVIVFVDGRQGAGLSATLEGWRGGVVSFLAAQVSAIVRGQQALAWEDRMRSVAAHQVKNPLAKIEGLVHAIKSRGPRPEYLDELMSSAREAIQNFEQTLHVERATSGRQIELEEVDLSELAGSVAASYRLLAHSRGCRLRVDLAPGCRTSSSPAHIRGILDNLINNAIRYTTESSGSVDVSLKRQGRECLLRVSDNGPGLPDDVRTAVASGTDPSPRVGYDFNSGFGLGLWIVSSYATLLGWRMTVGRCLPHGTAFTFRVPVQDPAQPSERP